MIALTREQVTQLLKMLGGDDPEETVCIEWHEEGPDGPGTYARYEEYPEEGKCLLIEDTTERRDTVTETVG